ncbi:MAG: arylesterase [Rhodobacteraceae bacterium]|nr:arylesterase [Paracoccaceae bacterium]
MLTALLRLRCIYVFRPALGNLAAILFAACLLVGGPGHAAPVTIVALGDSLTQGYGLAEGDGLVAQLQGLLDGEGADIRLINAGVSGDTSAGGLARIGWTLQRGPDALIVALGGNDLLRGLDPDLTRANITGILEAARAKGIPVLLVASTAPGNYGPDYQDRFDAIWGDLAAEFDVMLHRGFMDVLTEGREPSEVLANYLQADGLHPNRDGVALIAADLAPMVRQLADSAR